MALQLNQLIKMANLSADVKKEALESLQKLTERQKIDLSQICWESIVRTFENKARFEYDRMLEEMANGEKNYSPEDFRRIDDKMIAEMLKSIDYENSQVKLSEVKIELQKHLLKK